MLKNICKLISPELLKILSEMGHGDEIVIADANFPAHSVGQRVVRLDGVNIPELLKGILKLIPLDTYSADNAALMAVTPGDNFVPVICEKYKLSLRAAEGDRVKLSEMERFAFYERSKLAYAVVLTGEESLYANIILKKGVIK